MFEFTKVKGRCRGLVGLHELKVCGRLFGQDSKEFLLKGEEFVPADLDFIILPNEVSIVPLMLLGTDNVNCE
jgi:hypothetical protein